MEKTVFWKYFFYAVQNTQKNWTEKSTQWESTISGKKRSTKHVEKQASPSAEWTRAPFLYLYRGWGPGFNSRKGRIIYLIINSILKLGIVDLA